MFSSPLLDLPHLGDLNQACIIGRRACACVPALRAHHQIHTDLTITSEAWKTLRTTDKKGYLLAHRFADLLGDDATQAFTIFSSSGSSGKPFYWPQLRRDPKTQGEALRRLLETSFRIHERRTLAIIGLALGSWVGGEHFSWALKNLAATASYPFTVFSPGNHHQEILGMIAASEGFIDQILLVVCPSAIGHLRLLAEQSGIPLPLGKLRFLVVGEPFPEHQRIELQREIAPPGHDPVMLSIFGSADTGVLGCESPASAAIRRWSTLDPTLAADLGFSGVIPHLFHHADPETFLEAIDGELVVTRWQGIPLVRYNLHDAVRLLSWRGIIDRVRHRIGEQAKDLPEDLPDVLAISGRADACLLLCGTNLTEAMLDATVGCPEASSWLTGAYQARTILDQGRQRLELQVESRSGTAADHTVLYQVLTQALCRVQPEFHDDWERIYRRWDDDPERRIIALKVVPWPTLSNTTAIKHRGLRP